MADTTITAEKNDEESLPSLISLFEPTEESVCDFGDIILVADNGFHPVSKIRVSSCILANTPTFFKALFSKKYAEGQLTGEPGPREVTIKEKPSALVALCCLLHCRDPAGERASGEHDPLQHILELAITADKYDATKTIYLQAEALLTRHESDSYCNTHTLTLVAAACLLDSVKFFREFSTDLVDNLALIQFGNIPEGVLEHLPPGLISSVTAQIAVVRQQYTLEITELVEQFTRACERVGEPTSNVNTFLTKLKDAGLWPISFAIRWLCSPCAIAKTAAPRSRQCIRVEVC
ncbi:hypothetical protein CLAFUW4_11119 [Fulvia fulva]|uniref:BTB domain-containing protein n=1 Tax=Passalora fulva TaxID=5499 RepID=A0A9Q8PCL0_PASFU|nr:uncharacterized protein CLAFUR5_10161 [Fulvia fulva]KAK4619655.1 hypothetical protein CLAFUR4_11124 [Fulvia fulva]KAK4620775.1 hypothetical protein CLAFUR0_11130 [Fulvia fulva]UJO19998.1 hypothetical protein CLAFUR5_10161 [Fulvia fulva]WPV17759.1 hypothetical protein CLAFUW4_11119 [Fulvia fulva]WPV32252.1 hypothetical protein CLAFUW7_11115 [Fulvia fulva]